MQALRSPDLRIPFVSTFQQYFWTVTVPNDLSLLGAVYFQAAMVKPSGNPGGVWWTNAAGVEIGQK